MATPATPLMYTSADFKDDLETDLWVLNSIEQVPQETLPQTETIDLGNGMRENRLTIVDESLTILPKQEAVKEYRRRLTPLVFIWAQKVYAELFRLYLGEMGFPSTKTDLKQQVHVEDVIAWKRSQSGMSTGKAKTNLDHMPRGPVKQRLLASFSAAPLTFPSNTFPDQSDFDVWWNGDYDYYLLRKARNQVIHDKFDFSGDKLVVKDETGTVLIEWNSQQVLDFALRVRVKACNALQAFGIAGCP